MSHCRNAVAAEQAECAGERGSAELASGGGLEVAFMQQVSVVDVPIFWVGGMATTGMELRTPTEKL